ncbi:oxidoreductase [Dyella sp.]|uniref:oxidoreductase n=1 Tax=Dyella sp. TaxID=1869338 RepID=UPI002ED0CC18
MATWFITGISRGLGLSLARAVLAQGHHVYGTVRSGSPDLPASPNLHVIHLDVADLTAADQAIRDACTQAGQIDVLVNNAGYGLLGALENATDAEIDHLFTVDVFAPLRLIRSVLPSMRERRSGHIINITSIAGRAPGLGSAVYSTAKAALEGLSASLARELVPLGIKVTAIAPGAFRTDFLSTHSIRKSTKANEAYATSVGRGTAALDAMAGNQLGDPERAAAAIIQVVDSAQPPLHLLLGSDALARAREKLDAVIEEMDAWETLTRGTDYPSGA